MIYKQIKELNFKITVTDYEDKRNEYAYGWYKVSVREDMRLAKKERESALRELKEYSESEYTEELSEERMEIYDGDAYIGVVKIYMLDKVRTIRDFISRSEAKSGDAGVCACAIVDSGQFKKLVQNRRYAYIEWINLNEDYKTEQNEGLVLNKVLEFLKVNYRVERIFSRPVAINLSEDEVKVMRVDYHQVESNYYMKYGDYMVGFVRSYYADLGDNLRDLVYMDEELKSKVLEGYQSKKKKMHRIYMDNGMNFVKDDFEGVMFAEI